VDDDAAFKSKPSVLAAVLPTASKPVAATAPVASATSSATASATSSATSSAQDQDDDEVDDDDADDVEPIPAPKKPIIKKKIITPAGKK
jgi:hypothetical protein